MRRTVVIGLDGTSWNVLDPLLATGELPNLQALRDEGAHGILESTIPFYTGPAWASFATGSSPAAHGVYDFRMMREGDAITPASAADLRKKTYYEILAEEGVRPRDAAASLKMHPFVAEKAFAQAANFSAEELADAVVGLAALDAASKGGSRLPADLELERTLVEITRRS